MPDFSQHAELRKHVEERLLVSESSLADIYAVADIFQKMFAIVPPNKAITQGHFDFLRRVISQILGPNKTRQFMSLPTPAQQLTLPGSDEQQSRYYPVERIRRDPVLFREHINQRFAHIQGWIARDGVLTDTERSMLIERIEELKARLIA